MGPNAPRGVWFGFPVLSGERASDFLVLPDCCPQIIHSLPKDLQAPPQRAKMGAVEQVPRKRHEENVCHLSVVAADTL